MAPNSKAERLWSQEIRDYSISRWSAFDEATVRTDAWSSERGARATAASTGRGGRGGVNASKAKAVGLRRDLGSVLRVFRELLWRQRTWKRSHVHDSPSCCHGLDLAATRARAQVALENDSEEACEIKVDKDRTMHGLAHDRTGCVWHVRYVLRDGLQLDGHPMVDAGVNADGTLAKHSWLAAGWAPRMPPRTTASMSGRPTKHARNCSGVSYLRHFHCAFSNPWLLATVISTGGCRSRRAASQGPVERSTSKRCTARTICCATPTRVRGAHIDGVRCDRGCPTNTKSTKNVFGAWALNFKTSNVSWSI